MRKLLVALVTSLFLLGAQNVSADSLSFRETNTHKCKSSICGIYKGGKVETGNIFRNGKFSGTYRVYKSKSGKRKKTTLNERK